MAAVRMVVLPKTTSSGGHSAAQPLPPPTTSTTAERRVFVPATQRKRTPQNIDPAEIRATVLCVLRKTSQNVLITRNTLLLEAQKISPGITIVQIQPILVTLSSVGSIKNGILRLTTEAIRTFDAMHIKEKATLEQSAMGVIERIAGTAELPFKKERAYLAIKITLDLFDEYKITLAKACRILNMIENGEFDTNRHMRA